MAQAADLVLERRSPSFVRGVLPIMETATRWFRPTVEGLDRLPPTGPYLMVAPHSGGVFMPDAMVLMAAWLRNHDPGAELFCLAYDLLLSMPLVGRALERFGIVPASPAVAEAALGRGAVVLVYPGGDVEDCRPWRDRHHVDLAGHTGFVRLALRAGVPIVPVVAHGSHEAELIVTRGDAIARRLGLHRLRVHVFPLVASVPFGLVPIFIPHVPIPAHVTVKVLDPMDWSHLGPGAADNPVVVDAYFRLIVTRLQDELDRLAATPALPVIDPAPRAHRHPSNAAAA